MLATCKRLRALLSSKTGFSAIRMPRSGSSTIGARILAFRSLSESELSPRKVAKLRKHSSTICRETATKSNKCSNWTRCRVSKSGSKNCYKVKRTQQASLSERSTSSSMLKATAIFNRSWQGWMNLKAQSKLCLHFWKCLENSYKIVVTKTI